MTVIVALKDAKNKRIIIGADNQGTVGQVSIKGGKKIFSLDVPMLDENGDISDVKKLYVAMCGNYWLIDFLKYGVDVPAMQEDWDFIYYLYNCFLVVVADALSSRFLVRNDNGMLDSEAGMLMVFGDEIFHIYDNLSVMRCAEVFDVDGAGSEIATGSLVTNLLFHSDEDWCEIVRQAVCVCGERSIYCDDEVDLVVVDY